MNHKVKWIFFLKMDKINVQTIKQLQTCPDLMIAKYDHLIIHEAVKEVGQYMDETSYNRYATYEGDSLSHTFISLIIAQGNCAIVLNLRQFYEHQLELLNKCIACLNNEQHENVSILFVFIL